MSNSGTDSAATAYTVLGDDVRHEIEIKRSRFITVLRRVEDEPAARGLVAELRKEFHDARHHCSAFLIGPDRSIQRSSDDGEPSGTAGIPMLDALLKRQTASTAAAATDLSDVSAVVVRYFGGILLGAGGLVRAYTESVTTALDGARLVQRRRLRLFTVTVAHADAGRLENDLRTAGYAMTGNSYDAMHTLVGLAVPDNPGEIERLQARLAAVTAGRSVLVDAGTDWVDTPL